MDLEQAMEEAVALARQALDDDVGGPFGAVVLVGDAIVGRGRNRVLADRDPTAHAEVLAIRRACRELDRPTLDDAVLVSSCEPCPMCLAAAWWARVDQIVFAVDRDSAARAGFDDAFFYEELARPPAERRTRSVPLPWPEAQRVMAAWTRRHGRRLY